MSKKKKKPVDLFKVAKKVKGRVNYLQKSDYRGLPIHIRMVGSDMFEYFVLHGKDFYSGYEIISPRPGKKKLSDEEIAGCGALIFMGAVTTVDMLLGEPSEAEKRKLARQAKLAKKIKKVVNLKKSKKGK